MIINDIYNYENGYIGLLINLKGLPKTIEVDGYALELKNEFHITLINAGANAKLIDKDNSDKVESQIVDTFKEFIADKPLENFKVIKKFRLVKRDTRVTVVAMAEVNDLKDFFDVLNSKFDCILDYQPTHVTLYTLPNSGGIGLLSKDELLADSKEVEVKELENLRFEAHEPIKENTDLYR